MRPTLWALLAWTASIGSLAAPQRATASEPTAVPSTLSLRDIPLPYQERAAAVLDQPSFHVRGPSNTFRCNVSVYQWLLDHPDQAAKTWQQLGATCADISALGPGHFAWEDGNGSRVQWYNVVSTAERRAWYVEGTVRPGRFLPRVPVRALMIMHVQEKHKGTKQSVLRHQGELYLHTSSRAARIATRLLGASGPRMAEEYVGQIETFFGALAGYVTDHPEQWTKIRRNAQAGK